jgi:hypothetical protein
LNTANCWLMNFVVRLIVNDVNKLINDVNELTKNFNVANDSRSIVRVDWSTCFCSTKLCCSTKKSCYSTKKSCWSTKESCCSTKKSWRFLLQCLLDFENRSTRNELTSSKNFSNCRLLLFFFFHFLSARSDHNLYNLSHLHRKMSLFV